MKKVGKEENGIHMLRDCILRYLAIAGRPVGDPGSTNFLQAGSQCINTIGSDNKNGHNKKLLQVNVIGYRLVLKFLYSRAVVRLDLVHGAVGPPCRAGSWHSGR